MDRPQPEPLYEEADTRYGRMTYLGRDRILGRSLRQYGEWAQFEIDLMCDLLPKDGVALDVGAYIGTHTLAFGHHVSEGGRVHGFEPQPDFFQLLSRNVSANRFTNVELHNVGLSDRPGSIRAAPLDLALETNFGGTSLAEGHGGATVPVQTLDSLKLERCDLIKVDVEGMEAAVLAGAEGTIERCRPIVYAECNSGQGGWPVIEFMRRHGYEVFAFEPAAFNPHNFNASSDNFFGNAREIGLLLIHRDLRSGYELVLARHKPLVALESLDDLFAVLLAKPQYWGEILVNTAAGMQLARDESTASGGELRVELDKVQSALDKVQSALDQTQVLALERYEQIERMRQQMDRTQAALEEAQALAHERFAKLEKLRRSWLARLKFALNLDLRDE